MLSIIKRIKKFNRIHLVGIGGAGMCGIAEILIYAGYYVTGSDIIKNRSVRYLIKLGVRFFLGHRFDNVIKADIIVISSAIPANNPEIKAAKLVNIPILHRSEILSELMRFRYGIAIAGTHGKTTTTAMITSIYVESGLDPTFINGEIIRSEGVRARLGSSPYFIVEADESDGSFLCFKPIVEVLTNIEVDHMIRYNRNFKDLKKLFVKFLYNLPFYGYAVMCIDNMAIREILPSINRKIITYGFSAGADLHVLDYHQYIGKSSFVISFKNKKKLLVNLNIPGRHNALNATAAIAVAIEERISDENILKAIYRFQGVNRRFENLGFYSLDKINGQSGQIMLIDDYGHHPTELQVTIETIRVGWPDKRLVMIFQPHRFTRLQELYYHFVDVLSTVDILLILNVYAAGEMPILGADSRSLCSSICEYGKINPIFVSNTQILLETLFSLLRDNDLILIQGAGTLGSVARQFIVDSSSL